MELTTVKLWRRVGRPGQWSCRPSSLNTAEPVTYVPLDQVIELVEAAAAKERELDLNAKGAEYATYHYTYQRLESLAAQLKGANQ